MDFVNYSMLRSKGGDCNNAHDKVDANSQQTQKLPLLSVYEIRRKEVEESLEPVNGIFYIYNNEIIPDYNSECLVSKADSQNKKHMYHSYFYLNYMKRKFTELPDGEKSLPRGRIENIPGNTFVFIDKCYSKDEEVLLKLRELYRIPGKITVTSLNYNCPDCMCGEQEYAF